MGMYGSADLLVAFHSGHGRDQSGRALADVHAFSLNELEANHDYIQWLFPLFAPSAYNPAAPVLRESTVATFRSDPALRRALRESLEVMLRFYGLAVSANDGLRISRSPTFADRAGTWLTPGNHNYLRLTRILRSLSILGEGRLARALAACLLEDIYRDYARVIGETTRGFWMNALHIDTDG